MRAGVRTLYALALFLGLAPGLAAEETPAARRERVLAVARQVMTAARFCTMVTLGEGNEPHARIVDPLEPDESLAVYVATNPRSRKVGEIRKDARVTLLYFDPVRSAYVTLLGRAAEVNGAEKTRRHKKDWQEFFPVERPETYLLYRVVPFRAEVVSAKDGLNGDPATWRAETIEFGVSLAGPALAVQRAAPPKDPLSGFDAQTAQAVKDWRAPGFAIAVVKDGKVVFAKGYGVRALGQPGAVDTHTLFAIGSTTKAMTAAALGMLVDEKKLGWDDPVTRHLPWFALKDAQLTRELTVRDLLTHRAGMPNADFLWYGQSNSPREILSRMRLVEPAYAARSSFIYQNVMYAAAGAVLESVSGVPWERFIQTRIFDPLGMTDSIATAASLESRPNRAMPHYVIDGAVTQIENASVDGVAPAGAVWSGVDDMAKWMGLLLQGGVLKGGGVEKRLLSDATVSELFRPQTMVPPSAFYPTARITRPSWTTYGLGWFQQDYAGLKVDYHTGSIDGMVAICGLIRSQGIGVYVLSNLDHAELRHALMFTAFDRLLGREARDWSSEFLTLYGGLLKEGAEAEAKEDNLRTLGTRPSLPLSAYAGVYADALFGEVVVAFDARDQSLNARYGKGFVGKLEHWNFDTFRARWEAKWRGAAPASFVLDANGQPAELRIMGATLKRKAEAR